jgi:SAM-dependent methyltransferase
LSVRVLRAIAGLEADASQPAIEKLRRALDASGYSAQTVRAALGPELGQSHFRLDTPLYLRRLDAGNPLHAQIQLFAMDAWVGEREARNALQPLDLDSAAELGLIERDGRGVRGIVRIAAHDGLWLAHDRHEDFMPNPERDHVLGVNPAAITLANLTPRAPVRATLDLGAGCGVQALLSARHSTVVAAVDINPRALAFARFNALLNGAGNVDCLAGDMFAPVAERRFDLIVCNPPYVISPDSRFVFRDSGQPGDTICERVVRGAARQLEDGGFASILCNWALRRGEAWSAPLERWVLGSGCDAWLLKSDIQDPVTYAAIWNRSRETKSYAEALERWTGAYRELGIEAIGLGAVILRRRAGANWVRADPMPANPVEPCHDQILRVFRAHDFLSRLRDARELLGHAFQLAPDHQIRQTLKGRDGRWVVERAEVALDSGFRFQGGVDGYALRFLASGDGRRTLGDVLDELGKEGGCDANELADCATSVVQQMVALGLVVPVERAPDVSGA